MTLMYLLAQAAAAASPQVAATAVAPGQQGVISYPPAFFAAQRPDNAFEMIQRLPGFSFEAGDTVRGFEGAAGNVLIDAQRPSSKQDTLDEALRRIPASQVERIDLIRGGAPGIDMQGKSVLANVVRKAGSGQVHYLVGVAGGFVADDGRIAPSVRLEANGDKDGRKWEVSLRAGRGIDDGSGPGVGTRTSPTGTLISRYQIKSTGQAWNGTAAGSYELPILGGALRLNGRYFKNHYTFDEDDYFGFPPPVFVATDRYEEFEEQFEAGLRFSRDLGARSSLELVAIQQNKEDNQTDRGAEPGSTSFFGLDTTTGESIVRGVWRFRQSETLSWEAGSEGAFNWLESQTRLASNGVAVRLPAANVRVEEKRGEVFGKATWKPTPAWTVEAGVRQEASAISSEGDVTLEKTLTFTKPRLAVTWAPSAETQLRFRFERTVGQLNFSDFTASSSASTGTLSTGNPDIEPQQAWVTEVAAERRFWKSGALVLTLRHSALSDAIDRVPVFTPTGAFDAPGNIGEGTKDEAILNLTLPLDRFGLKGAQLRGQGTWRRSEVTDPGTFREREISALRPVEWEAHYTQDLPNWNIVYGADVYGGWREARYKLNEVELRKLKTYVVPFVEWKPRTDFNVRLEVQNATERGFRNTRFVYAGPRRTSPLSYVSDRDVQFGRIYYVRVRKMF